MRSTFNWKRLRGCQIRNMREMLKMRLVIVLTIVCFIVQVCVLVQGRYLVEVRLNGYSNPTGKCEDHRRSSGEIQCCDSSDTIDCSDGELCDSYFIYCLRSFCDNRQLGCFPSEKRTTSSTNVNDGRPDFSRNTVLGLANPQTLSGLEVPYNGVQVYIEIQDEDNNDDDLVDLLLINHNLSVAESLQQNHIGIYNFVIMDLTITVLCEGNFGGSDCTQCVPGFTGSNCDKIDNCFGVNCSGSGECLDKSNSFTCKCDSGYKGELCESIDCSANNCSGNGICMDDINISDFPSCNCSTGFIGRVCEIAIDVCLSNPCKIEALAPDSVATNDSAFPKILAGILGGGIAGVALLLLMLILSTTVAAVCWSRKSRVMSHRESLRGQFVGNEESTHIQQLQSDDQVFELTCNDAYGSTIHSISTEYNVAYGQATPQIPTEDNVCYGEMVPQIPTTMISTSQ